MIGYYNPSVIVTYIGLMCSVAGMALSITGHMQLAFSCLLVCGLCDMIDGPIARRCKRTEDEKSFGIHIDSLCDLVCFGAFPAVICMTMAKISWYTALVSAFFVLAGVIRLGYFNVHEIKRAASESGVRKTYDGLPITSSALILPAAAALDALLEGFAPWIYVAAQGVVGLLFILPIHIPKLHSKGLAVCGLLGAAVIAVIIIKGSNLTAA